MLKPKNINLPYSSLWSPPATAPSKSSSCIFFQSIEEYRQKAAEFPDFSLSFCEFFSNFATYCHEKEILMTCHSIMELAHFFCKDNPTVSYEESLKFFKHTDSYGFTAQKENKIYALAGNKGKHGAYHEIMHLLSAPGGKTKMYSQISINLMEGTNEFFTREIEKQIPNLDLEVIAAYQTTYPKQCDFIQILIDNCGISVKNALFRIHFAKEDSQILIDAMFIVWKEKSLSGKLKTVYKTPIKDEVAKKFLQKFLTDTSSSIDGTSDNSLAIKCFKNRFPADVQEPQPPSQPLPLPPYPPPPLPGAAVPDTFDISELDGKFEDQYLTFKKQMKELLNLAH